VSTLQELSVNDAASKAVELMLYGEYASRTNGEHAWRSKYDGSFNDFLVENYFDGEEDDVDFLSASLWQELKYEGGEGTRDGWTGKKVADHGGEGEGDQYWMVVSLSDGTDTRYFRMDGWYASYHGGELDGDVYEVRPQERVVVVYEDKV
jgi:hypothetical protein